MPRTISLTAMPLLDGFTVTTAFAVTLAVIVIVHVMVMTVVPEVAVMVIVNVPGVAELLAVIVSTLVVVVGLGLNAAVTPVGRPEAASVTLPVNPPVSVTVMVQVPEPPATTFNPPHEIVKPGLAVTVIVRVALLVTVPDVPVMVKANPPTVAVLLAVMVSTQLPLPVMGLVHPEIVMPPDPAVWLRVTVPLNGLTSVTVIVRVVLEPWTTVGVPETPSVKLPVDDTVTETALEVLVA
jgi:hypothetical protein